MRIKGENRERGKNLPRSFDLPPEYREAFLWLFLHPRYSQRSQSQNPVIHEKQRFNNPHSSSFVVRQIKKHVLRDEYCGKSPLTVGQ